MSNLEEKKISKEYYERYSMLKLRLKKAHNSFNELQNLLSKYDLTLHFIENDDQLFYLQATITFDLENKKSPAIAFTTEDNEEYKKLYKVFRRRYFNLREKLDEYENELKKKFIFGKFKFDLENQLLLVFLSYQERTISIELRKSPQLKKLMQSEMNDIEKLFE